MKPRLRAPFIFLLSAISLIAFFVFTLRVIPSPDWESTTPPLSDLGEISSISPIPSSPIGPFTFTSYNVKNWLSSPQNPEKSPESKRAVIHLLKKSRPDVIGLCEIGSVLDVKEIQKMLSETGVDFPFFHHTGGEDPYRHLAILSRYPLFVNHAPHKLVTENQVSMQRGILDVSVEIHDTSIRFIGVHLKSKRAVSDLDPDSLRLAEATHLRAYADAIFQARPDEKMIVYGDFNDHPQSLSSRTIFGNFRSVNYLKPLPVSDRQGETWTYHFAKIDSYSRIDYITASLNLLRFFQKEKSFIEDDPRWEIASDHRPISVRFE